MYLPLALIVGRCVASLDPRECRGGTIAYHTVWHPLAAQIVCRSSETLGATPKALNRPLMQDDGEKLVLAAGRGDVTDVIR